MLFHTGSLAKNLTEIFPFISSRLHLAAIEPLFYSNSLPFFREKSLSAQGAMVSASR